MGLASRISIGVRMMILSAATSAAIAADVGHVEARHLREIGVILPFSRIVRLAAERQPGKLLDSELDREGGRYVYELEILDSGGTVHELEVDAASGEILDHDVDD